MQLLELVIFAALAAVVLYNLYAVLGRKVGRQPEDGAPGLPDRTAAGEAGRVEGPAGPLSGMASLRARDPSFEPGRFLQGAKSAFERVVTAFAAGDREMLRRLLSPLAVAPFETAIDAREAEGRSEKVEFLSPVRADLDRAETDGDIGRAVVRFLAEMRRRAAGPEGETVDDRRTAELWTFERRLGSPDPNWTLVRVDAAEA